MNPLILLLIFSRPLRGLRDHFDHDPRAEALGYFHLVRCADHSKSVF